MGEFLGALDQGTTSTRFIVFHPDGREVVRHQEVHRQLMPHPGWLEHEPEEIWERCCTVIGTAMKRANLRADDFAAIGIANQRETTVLWDRRMRGARDWARAVSRAFAWNEGDEPEL